MVECSEGLFDFPSRLRQIQRQQWIDRFGRGRVTQLSDERLRLFHVHDGQRRTTMRARRAFGDIDGTAAARTVDGLNVPSEVLQLGGRQRLDEVLLAQKIERRDEAAVTVIASPVLEGCIAL